MPDPPVPVLMLYAPEEFWAAVRTTVREEIAAANTQTTLLQSALDKAGLPLKPAYTPGEIQKIFELSETTFNEWTSAGLLRLTRIGQQTYILYTDLITLFHAK